MSADAPRPEPHRLLQRQLRRLGLQPGIAPDAEGWDRLLERVSRTYTEADSERYLMERSESLASAEMASLNEALKSARDSAEALAAVKATFLANMSHEIRTPLNAVLGMAYLAMQNDPSPRQRDYLEKIRQAGQHLLGIINDILDFSKIEAGRLQVEQVAFDLDQVLEDVMSMVTERARAKGLALSLEVGDQVPPRLLGDPQKLRQILINYLNNAVKFTEAGSVTLRVAAGPRHDDGRQPLRFEVRDTGIGVAASEVDRIFRSFEQADASTTRRYGGTGLGLAICRRLAELMGGAVGVVSEPGKGATFWCELRLALPAAVEGAPADSGASAGYQVRVVGDRHPEPLKASAGIRGARVLLVEDNELNQQVASELLDGLGVQVDVAADGRQAIERLQQSDEHRYGLVLMDVHMPVMDGIEATRTLRALPRFATIPIVAMTASVLPEERQRVLDAGMHALLPKPVDPAELEACLLQWLPARKAVGAVDAAEAPLTPPGPLPAVEGLDVETGLRRCGGDPRFYLRMLRTFAARWSDLGARARACVAQREWARLHLDAHSFKGLCGTLGAHGLQALAQRLEQSAAGLPEAGADASAESLRDVTSAIDPLEAALLRLLAGLRVVLDRSDDGLAPEDAGNDGRGEGADASGAAPGLEALDLARALELARQALSLLEASELVVVQHVDAERELFRAWMGHDRFSALDGALRDYDLERAEAVLSAAVGSLKRGAR